MVEEVEVVEVEVVLEEVEVVEAAAVLVRLLTGVLCQTWPR